MQEKAKTAVWSFNVREKCCECLFPDLFGGEDVKSKEGQRLWKEINDKDSFLCCYLWTWAVKMLIEVYPTYQSFNQPFTADQ